jgi:hypothetical protein
VLELLDDLSSVASLKIQIDHLASQLTKAIKQRDKARRERDWYRSQLLKVRSSKWVKENKK